MAADNDNDKMSLRDLIQTADYKGSQRGKGRVKCDLRRYKHHGL